MAYRIQYSPEAGKVLTSMERSTAQRIVQKINELAEDPRNAGNVKALKGKLKHIYRLRVSDYRVLYHLKDEMFLILILEIGNRKDIYR